MERKVQKIFFKKDSGTVRVFNSEEELQKAGFTEADKVTTEDEYNSKGCYARIIDGEIFIGQTEAEKNKAEEMELLAKLAEIDRLEGASRPIRETVRNLANSAGLDTSRIMTHETEAARLRAQLEIVRKRKSA